MNKDTDVGESCDSKPNYPCGVKQQDEQAHLVCLGDLVMCLVYRLVWSNQTNEIDRMNQAPNSAQA